MLSGFDRTVETLGERAPELAIDFLGKHSLTLVFVRYPDRIVIEEDQSEAEEASGPAKDDFFNNMIATNASNGRSTPSLAAAARASPAPRELAPSVARATPSPAPSEPEREQPSPQPQAAPLAAASKRAESPAHITIPTSAPKEPSPDTLTSPVLTSHQPSQVLAASSSLLGGSKARKGLGAKKAVKAGISFEEAERRAREEEERIRLEDEERKRAEEDARKRDPLGFAMRPNAGAQGGSSRLNYDPTRGGDEDALDRLGMGMGRLAMGGPGSSSSAREEKKEPAKFGFGYDPTAPPKKSAFGETGGGFGSTGFGSTGGYGNNKSAEDEEFARKKFGTAKAISSDQYFGRGHWNDEGGWVPAGLEWLIMRTGRLTNLVRPSNEAREKLRNFEGRSGFGSSDYYGRSNESGGDASSPTGSVGDLAGQASDFVRRFGEQAGDDWSNLKNLGAAVVQKASNVLQDVSVSGCGVLAFND